MAFRKNVACMVNSILVSSDIPVLINILFEIIKMLRENVKMHQKILNTIYLHWFQSNASEENNSVRNIRHTEAIKTE